jgi:hypothetical protein
VKLTTILSCTLAIAGCLQAQSKTPQGFTSQPNQTDGALTAQPEKIFQTATDNILKISPRDASARIGTTQPKCTF